MAGRMRRTQVLLPEEEYERLKEVAHEQRRSIGSLVREAVAKQFPRGSREARLAAVRQLAEMQLPVADWAEMEEEIMRGAILDE